jgi:hypothetical protein
VPIEEQGHPDPRPQQKRKKAQKSRIPRVSSDGKAESVRTKRVAKKPRDKIAVGFDIGTTFMGMCLLSWCRPRSHT